MMGEGITRRVFASCLEFARGRKVWGKYLTSQPIMQDTLLTMMAETEAALVLLFRVGSVLIMEDRPNPNQPDSNELQRILCPMSKFRCCRRGVDIASMGVEIYGGNGYIEDWPMERQYRDAQNHPMWEGTEIVLSLDVIRALPSSLSALVRLLTSIELGLSSSTVKSHRILGTILKDEITLLTGQIGKDILSSAARFANMLTDLCQFALLCEQALYVGSRFNQFRSFIVAAIFANNHFSSRESRWVGVTKGGYPKVLLCFDDLVDGKVIPSDVADAVVIELLAPQSKL